MDGRAREFHRFCLFDAIWVRCPGTVHSGGNMVFCKNCGNKLSEGARFCSVCGARVEPETEPTNKNNAVRRTETAAGYGKPGDRPAMTDSEWKDDRRQRRAGSSSGMTFDWSSVIDDTHRKATPDIRSPWESTGLDDDSTPAGSFERRNSQKERIPSMWESPVEDRVARDSAASSGGRERTLTYIDILKQEKGLKDAKSGSFNWDDEAPASSGGKESLLKNSEMEKTQGYDDLSSDITARLSGGKKEERKETGKESGRENAGSADSGYSERRIPDFEEQLEYIRARRKARTEAPEPPRSFVESAEDEEKAIERAGKAAEEKKRAARAAVAAPAVKTAPASSEDDEINSELADILGGDTEFMDEDAAPVHVSAASRAVDQSGDSEFDLDRDIELNDEGPEEKPAASEETQEESYEDFETDYLDLKPRAGRAARNSEAQAMRDLEDSTEDKELESELEALAPDFAGDDDESHDTNIDEYLTPEEDQEPAAVKAEAKAEAPEKTAAQKTAEDLEAEIQALSRKLASLTGADVDVPEKEAAPVEKPAPQKAEAPAQEAAPSVAQKEPGEELTFGSYDDYAEDIQDIPEEKIEEKAVEETEEKPVADETPVQETAPAEAEDDLKPLDSDMDIDKELAALGFDLDSQPEEQAAPEDTGSEDDLVFTEETTDTSVLPAQDGEPSDSTMSIDELENDIFGTDEDASDLEATRKIEKFYTLYRKNEEFQKLLDEEYQKLKEGSADYSLMDEPVEETDTADMYGTGATIAMEVAEVNKALEEANAQQAGQQAQAASPAATAQSSASTSSMSVPEQPAAAAAPAATAAPLRPEEDDEEEEMGKGGRVLTVIAIIVAVLLVILLVVIMILNFAPNSGAASALNNVIANFTQLIGAGQSN